MAVGGTVTRTCGGLEGWGDNVASEIYCLSIKRPALVVLVAKHLLAAQNGRF
jgi:hypothetical protein